MKELGLSRKLLVLVVTTSTVFTTITSCIQIAMEYGKAKDDQKSAMEVFGSVAVPSFQNLLWRFNDEALKTQLKESLNSRDFVHVRLENEKHETQGEFRKPGDFKFLAVQSFALKNPTNDSESIGSVTLEYTNDFIFKDLRLKALIILITNSLKTLGVSAMLLWLFRIHNVERLSRLATHLRSQNWQHPTEFPQKSGKWPFKNMSDEISQIEKALNIACEIIDQNNRETELREKNSARLVELGILSAGIAHEINT
jgi:HAMP domain-containing protein